MRMCLNSAPGPDILTTRTPYRPTHLQNALNYTNQGLLLLGGATPDGNPNYNAYWLFTNYATPATIQSFMSTDPYVQACDWVPTTLAQAHPPAQALPLGCDEARNRVSVLIFHFACRPPQNNLVMSYRITNLTVPNVNNPATNASSLINSAVDTATNTQQTYNLTTTASPVKTFIALFYVYGNDIFTTRTPYRAGHLANANSYINSGLLVVGGAYPPTDPTPYGAWFLFNENANASTIAQFVASDPYNQNNLLVNWFWRNWSVPIISSAVDAVSVPLYSPPPPPSPSPRLSPSPLPAASPMPSALLPPVTPTSVGVTIRLGLFTLALSLAAALIAA